MKKSKSELLKEDGHGKPEKIMIGTETMREFQEMDEKEAEDL